MFSRLSVRTRLLVAVAVPLIALGGLTAVFLGEQFDRRSEATNDRAITQAFVKNGDASAALQAEEMLTAAYILTGDAEIADQLSALRAETDAAFETAIGALNVVGIKDPDGQVGSLVERYGAMISGLPELRSQVDTSERADVVDRLEDYDTKTGVASEMNTTLASAASVATDLRADVVLDQTMTATGRQFVYATVLTAADRISETVRGRFEASSERADALYLTYRTVLADGAQPAIVDAARRDEAAREAGTDLLALTSGVPAKDVGTNPATFGPAAVSSFEVFSSAKTEIATAAVRRSDERFDDANEQVRVAVAIAVVGLLITATIALIVVRSVTRPLRKLSGAAEDLAQDTLPRLVDSMINPGIQPPEVKDIGIGGSDEIGQLAAAFNGVQQSIVEVSHRQNELVTRGISDMYINLARRNQSLLDRQIEYLDTLESIEQDPDQLERLFRLDHLATRMRRNAESLLVLAGAEHGKRRTRPVPLVDVVRVAIGEVEDYQRLDILEIDEISLRGDAAVDLAHLLSELMENGTQYSPPETSVDVVGSAAPDGGYAVVVTDHGMGMTEAQLVDANEELATPPALGLGAGRSLGFTVVAALASRHQISVRLSSGEQRGVIAEVTLPQGLVDATTLDGDAGAPMAVPALAATAASGFGADYGSGSDHDAGSDVGDASAPAVARWVEQVPTGEMPVVAGGALVGASIPPFDGDADSHADHDADNDNNDRTLPRWEAPFSAPRPPTGERRTATWQRSVTDDPATQDQAEYDPNSHDPNSHDPNSYDRDSHPSGHPAEGDPIGQPAEVDPAPIGWASADHRNRSTPLDPYAEPGTGDPGSFIEAVPLGEAFELGLYSLLDSEPVEPPSEPSSSTSLPVRSQGEALGPDEGDPNAVVAGESSRSPDEVRSMLSKYRSARDQGKRDAAEDVASTRPETRPAYDPLGEWDFGGYEDPTSPDGGPR